MFGVVSAAAPLSTFASGSTGSVFGSGTSSVFGGDSSASGSSFSFSSTEAPASQLSFGNVPSFSGFGSAAASFQSFGSLAKSDSASFAPSTDKPAFEAAAATNLLATTVETNDEFKDRVQERTGEEDDEVHLRIATKVYQMKEVPVVTEAHPEGEVTAAIAATTGGSAPAAATGTVTGAAAAPAKTVTKYVEIGSGELHVNSVEDQSTHKIRARLVLREDRTKRNVLNAPLFVGMTYKIEGDKFVKFHSLDLEGKMATFLLKVKQQTNKDKHECRLPFNHRLTHALRYVADVAVVPSLFVSPFYSSSRRSRLLRICCAHSRLASTSSSHNETHELN